MGISTAAGVPEPVLLNAFPGALEARYVLRLYVTGHTANSVKAIANVKALCEEYLADRYEMQVVDIYENPVLASEDQVVAVPTLVKVEPGPRRRLIGDMSDKGRVLSGLGLAWRTHG